MLTTQRHEERGEKSMGALYQFQLGKNKALAKECWTDSDKGRPAYGVVMSNIPFMVSIPYNGKDLETIPGTQTWVKLFKTIREAMIFATDRMKFLISLSTIYAASPPPIEECDWMDGAEIQMKCFENARETFSPWNMD